jgi:hypothetical protein
MAAAAESKPSPSRLRSWLGEPFNQLLLLVGLFLVCAAAIAPIQRKGDASEYILATESIVHDFDLVYSDEVDLRRHAMSRPEGLLDVPAGLTTLRGTDRRLRFGLHSFYYPAAAAPFYAVFGYRGFFLLNALCLFSTIALVYAHASRVAARGGALLFATASVLLSAAWGYLFFTQTEAFYAALLTAFFFLWLSGRPRWAALFAGIAFGAQLPLSGFFLPFAFDLARQRKWKDLAVSSLIIGCAMAPQIDYNAVWIGAVAPMNARGLAQVSYLDGGDFLRTLFDPSMGVLWFYPIIPYCLLNTKYGPRTSLVLAASLLIAVAMNTVHNIYSHQIGIRFGNYLFPGFLFLLHRLDATEWTSRLAIAFAVFSGAGLAIDPIGNSYDMDLRKKAFLPYRIVSALGFYRESPEAFRTSAERLSGAAVYGRRMFPDRWTHGGETATLLVERVEPCDLKLNLGSWGLAERQHLTIGTPSETEQHDLPPASASTVTVALGKADILHYRGEEHRAYTYLEIRAEPWTPAWNVAGGEGDRRRIGVRLLEMSCGDRRLMGPP